MLPDDLNNKSSINIIERQSTFLKLSLASGKTYKVGYVNKKEFFIEELEVTGCAIFEKHPLLIEYQDSLSDLYISSQTDEPDNFIKDLVKLNNDFFCGWRGMQLYFNNQYGYKNVVKDGLGLLYKGPSIFIKELSDLLDKYQIKYKVQNYNVNKDYKYKVLLLGNSFVIAEEFTFELVD